MIELKELGVTFSIIEKVTVRSTLRFWSGWAQATGETSIVERWELVCKLDLIKSWKCEYFPDHKVSLEDIEDVRVANVIIETLSRVFAHMLELRAVSKK